MILNLIVIAIGLVFSILLFYKFPVISKVKSTSSITKISIVIPARNEERTLPLLLKDLKKQDFQIHEIICVDDESEDNTEKIILDNEAILVSVQDKPKDWTGKSWACELGATRATGDLILFLDADVRLAKDSIGKLVSQYENEKCVISVQPYHHTEKNYEQLSLFFNIVQIAANGVCVPFKNKSVGLFGPVILIKKEDYKFIGTHDSVKKSIIEDVSLGQNLIKSGKKFKLFMGGDNVSFRMYGDGFKSLYEGWSKNFATGAMKTDFLILVMVFWWLTASASTFINVVYSCVDFNLKELVIYLALYIIWVVEIFRISIKTGKYMKWAVLIYPIPLLAFFVIFILSLIKKIFRLNTTWKQRKIKL